MPNAKDALDRASKIRERIKNGDVTGFAYITFGNVSEAGYVNISEEQAMYVPAQFLTMAIQEPLLKRLEALESDVDEVKEASGL